MTRVFYKYLCHFQSYPNAVKQAAMDAFVLDYVELNRFIGAYSFADDIYTFDCGLFKKMQLNFHTFFNSQGKNH